MVDRMTALHEVAARLRHLRSELQASQDDSSKVVIAARHSLLTLMLPTLLLDKIDDHRMLLKFQSAYPEDGVALLLNRQVDILVACETRRRRCPITFASILSSNPVYPPGSFSSCLPVQA